MMTPLLQRLSICCIVALSPFFLKAQSAGTISGDLQTTANFFIRDSLIGAAQIPQYDRQLYGADSWLTLNYSNWGFDFGIRYDLFNNSNLLIPTDSYTDQGIGRWFISKQIDKLGITGGYIYDQIGSGMIFRSFEQRPLLIDNALIGLRLTYDINDNWKVKAFTGQQKNLFEEYESIIKGINAEGFLSVGKEKPITLAPGIGIVNRTLDNASVDALVATIATYPIDDIFTPQFNTYAFTFYNTLNVGPLTWYLETAFKTKDVMNNSFGRFSTDPEGFIRNRFINKAGSVLYTSFSAAAKGIAADLSLKRTENFSFRTRPQVQLNRGLINFLPPMARVNTFRLTARYLPATQELGEWAAQLDLRYSIKRKWNFLLNFSNINTLDDQLLYREVYWEGVYRQKRDWKLLFGIQHQNYNQAVFEFKPDVPNVQTITTFAEFDYRLNKYQSLRFEFQYMHVGEDERAEARQDYGNWLFGLVEWSIAPHWTFTVSDMYNVTPGKNAPIRPNGERYQLHYPRFDVFYTKDANRFSLSYIKQVEGVVCTGGICRLEPAFSGFKFTVNSTF
ncbi:MAG: DUF6029 family protein [Bacteroidota bacterium]